MFLKILISILLEIVILNALKYICKFLQCFKLIRPYKDLLDRPNITYIVIKIKKIYISKVGLSFISYY